jgi:hypothetical protein
LVASLPRPEAPSPAGEREPSDVVGHKTLRNERGELYHEPLRRDEAEALIASADAARAKRAADMPTEAEALRVMFAAFQRLNELGWRDAIYCPKDGSSFDVIEAGSTGIHRAHYEGEWPKGGWWIEADDDLWPSRPILYRPGPEELARWARAREALAEPPSSQTPTSQGDAEGGVLGAEGEARSPGNPHDPRSTRS